MNSRRAPYRGAPSGSPVKKGAVLSICPTNWGMSPLEAVGWMEKNMMPYYPLGVFRSGEEVAK